MVFVQAETLETILGVSRSNSAFYPEPDSRTGKEVGNKPDSRHGVESKLPVLPLPELVISGMKVSLK